MENDALKAEADALLAKADVATLLASYEEWFVGGSYAYDLMCWRDLDVYALDPGADLHRCFRVAYEVTRRLGAVKARFTNNRGGVPDGFYWAILFGDARNGAWKIDMWYLSTEAYRQHRKYADELRRRVTAEQRRAICAIKDKLWPMPEYRNTITSDDVYRAVLDGGVRTYAAFEQWRAHSGRGTV